MKWANLASLCVYCWIFDAPILLTHEIKDCKLVGVYLIGIEGNVL
jgi:hypothetical protein